MRGDRPISFLHSSQSLARKCPPSRVFCAIGHFFPVRGFLFTYYAWQFPTNWFPFFRFIHVLLLLAFLFDRERTKPRSPSRFRLHLLFKHLIWLVFRLGGHVYVLSFLLTMGRHTFQVFFSGIHSDNYLIYTRHVNIYFLIKQLKLKKTFI